MPDNPIPAAQPPALSSAQIDQFIRDGFVKLERAFPRELAAAGCAILWRDLPCRADDPASWTRPVVRLGQYHDEPFKQAVNTPRLYAAFDQLVGPGRWRPRPGLGTFPVRFPHPDDPGDAGWHVDLSFPGPDSSSDARPGFSNWRVNWLSQGRALLMLFLFSDIGEHDAPTRIKTGSHRDVARYLQPAGEAGRSADELSQFSAGLERPQVLATGAAGDVYLCHPFLAHAAQMHRGRAPRFLAQPPLHPSEPLRLDRADAAYSPVEIAIRHALGKD
ncbi:phytanoyl-CoA dioxygenase [Bradyrhizobium sp. SSBR45G]|uniref:phytanoyl-CoA dioxygenase n=1 Tax=unclassified Bradyrhizobium TaxID=2631580 RepID=UPI002342A325|nr:MULTISPECIES: phytanoyl-CoA dioxygenase [unclassified Bradyrhizobium]GLH80650.1 phytanoyl-CoA dioxygenase [Bradyrhizobium sp. SSBR45G]GLH85856.1 phytanoyl-CoA dioxygenase [Bradyrhizobium sp. SSBR45R]